VGVVSVIGVRRGRVSVTRVAALAAIVLAVGGGAVALRAGDLGDLLRVVGIGDEPEKPATEVETFTHRSVLLYLGVRIALDHPLLGVGWQGSALQDNVEPYLDDARGRFPDAAPEAFPSRAHPWGVQNAFVQAAADLGLVGAILFVGLFAAGLAAAAPVALGRRGSDPRLGAIAALWLVVAAAALAFYGLYAGVPVDALLWLALGLAVASRRV
jgi:O-antigen ligase